MGAPRVLRAASFEVTRCRCCCLQMKCVVQAGKTLNISNRVDSPQGPFPRRQSVPIFRVRYPLLLRLLYFLAIILVELQPSDGDWVLVFLA